MGCSSDSAVGLTQWEQWRSGRGLCPGVVRHLGQALCRWLTGEALGGCVVFCEQLYWGTYPHVINCMCLKCRILCCDTSLRSHHRNEDNEHLHHPRKSPRAFQPCFPVPRQPPICSPFLRHLCKCNYSVSALSVCLFSLGVIVLRFPYLVASMNSAFFLLLSGMLCVPACYAPLCRGQLGSQLWAVTKRAAVNIHAQAMAWMHAFIAPEHTPGIGVTRS